MSCVIGLRDDRIWLAADTRLVAGSSYWHVAHSKLYRSGTAAIGAVGSLRAMQLLQRHFEREPLLEVDPMSIADRMREVLGTNTEDFAMLIAGEKLWQIDSDLTVYEPEEFTAIGSASDLALGSLCETAGLPPLTRLERALACAARFNCSVAPPFEFVSV